MKLRRKPNVTYAIVGATSLGLALLVGNEVLESVGTTIGNISNTPFYQALSFLGMNDTGGTWKTTGIVGILGLAAVASFVLTFFQLSFKGMA
jgi:hypothetical protein